MEILKKVPKKALFLLLIFAVLAIAAVFLFSSKPKIAGAVYDSTSDLNFNLVTIGGIEGYEVSKGNNTSGAKIIPESHNGKPVISISSSAFENCSNLTNITIPNSVISIKNSAFNGCSNIEKITIGNNTTSIGHSAFFGCSSLTSITIPSSVINIDALAFSNCGGIESINVSTENSVYKSDSNCIIRKSDKALTLGCKTSEIPDYVTRIDDRAFFDCRNLKNITIPNSVTSIGICAFYFCSSLTSIEIPNSITSIGYFAFYNCNSLTSIEIPKSVTSIGDGVFSGCNNLQSITLPFVGNIFNGTTNTHFGYIFGAVDYLQNSTYMPSSLKTVTITGGRIDANAFNGCGNIINIVIENSVTDIGSGAFKNCTGLTSITLPFAGKTLDGTTNTHFGYIFGASSYSNNSSYVPKSLKTVTMMGGRIDNNAFRGCGNITSIIIENGVASIGNSAFYDCSSLTSIIISNSVASIGSSAFRNCSSLTGIIIPNSVASIGSSAFQSCSSLTSITLPFAGNTLNGTVNTHFGYIFGASSYGSNSSYVPSSLKTVTIAGNMIDANAFYGCGKITSIIIENNATSIGSYAFYNCTSLTSITIPNSVKSIGDRAFYYCRNLTSITIPNSVISISDYTFGDCSSLTSIIIPNSVTSIGSSAFSYCTSLTSITIPNSVKSIGDRAFYYCRSLTSITIPNSVISIGAIAFYNCSGLESINVSTENSVYKSDENCLIKKSDNVLILGCKNSVISDYVTSISDYAFYNCSGLTSIIIPNSITSIGNFAFYNCNKLESIAIPNSVTSIGDSAFSSCNNLQSITIPFVGNIFNGTTNTHFGYIFGAVDYLENSTYIPSLLKTVTITGGRIDANAFNSCGNITNIVAENSITTIGSGAFRDCTGLTGITLPFMGNSLNGTANTHFGYIFGASSYSSNSSYVPKSLKTVTMMGGRIDNNAFRGCGNITSIIIENGVASIGNSAFYDCSSLTSIIISNSVTSIGSSAFRNCSSLTGIIIPNSVASIGNSAFNGCTKLADITLPFAGNTLNGTENTHFGYIFGASSYGSNSSYVPSSLKTIVITGGKSINSSAFFGCSSLTSITIPNSVTNIGNSAFYNCSGLTSIIIPSNVTSIGNSTFYDCSSLTSITIPNGVTTIGNFAFNNCSSLISIIIPSSVTNIGSCAFYDCSSLINIIIPSSVTTIGHSAFNGCTKLVAITLPFAGNTLNGTTNTYFGYIFGASSYSSNSSSVPTSLKTVTITGDNTIHDYAFYNCSGLTSIMIPNSVTSIGSSAFYNCTSLMSITIPNSVTTIGSSAFRNCSSLTGIIIPNSVASIGGSAFNGCTKLAAITLPFVGNTLNGTANTHFGYIFGASSYSSNSSSVPTSLKTVIITGGNTISEYAFYGCSGLASITIPDSVITIGSYSFYDCSSLASITIPDSVISIGDSAFTNTGIWNNTANNNVIYADKWAVGFKGTLTEASLRSDTLGISDCAFQKLGDLKAIKLSISLKYIGDFAFLSCGLNSISIPDSIKNIGKGAFKGCGGLTNIVIPNSVESIGFGAFEGCKELSTVTLPFIGNTLNGTVTHFGYIFGASSYDNNSNFVPQSLKTVIIKGGSIIDDGAFYGCKYLTDITIPNSVENIGNNAFDGCNNLVDITIPSNVKSIGGYAFNECDKLKTFNVLAEETKLGKNALGKTKGAKPDLIIYIKDSSFNYYNSAIDWAIYADVLKSTGTSSDPTEPNGRLIQDAPIIGGVSKSAKIEWESDDIDVKVFVIISGEKVEYRNYVKNETLKYILISETGNYNVYLINSYQKEKLIDFTIDSSVEYLTNIADGVVTNESVYITDNEIKSSTITLTKGGININYNFGEEISDDGEYVAVIKDYLGNTAILKFTIITKQRNGFTYQCPDGFEIVKYLKNNVNQTPPPNGLIKLNSDGTYVIEIRNLSDNSISYIYTVTIDTMPPVLNFDKVNFNDGSLELRIVNNSVKLLSTEKKLSSLTVKLNDVEIEADIGTVFRQNGTYKVIAIDEVGNTNTYEFVIAKKLDLLVFGLSSLGVVLVVTLFGIIGHFRRKKQSIKAMM